MRSLQSQVVLLLSPSLCLRLCLSLGLGHCLGLRRIQEDDRQFLGFFSESPDAYNVGTRTLTTMRSNCISCHSTASYGIDTIFSLRRSPVVDEENVSGRIALELVDASLGHYKLRSAEAQALAAYAADDGGELP